MKLMIMLKPMEEVVDIDQLFRSRDQLPKIVYMIHVDISMHLLMGA